MPEKIGEINKDQEVTLESQLSEFVEPPAEPSTADQSVAEMAEMKKEIATLTKQISDSRTEGYSRIQSERNTLLDRFSKLIGVVEGAGIGTYDQATGEITKTQPQEAAPKDDTAKQIADMQQMITEKNAFLRNEEISEYEIEKTTDQIEQIKEDIREIKYQAKLAEAISKIKPPPTKTSTATIEAKEADRLNIEAREAIAQVAPEVRDPNSPLFKKMIEIYQSSGNTYAKANEDPAQYKSLVEKAQSVIASPQVGQPPKGDPFINPTIQKGYQKKTPTKSNLSKAHVSQIMSQGIKDSVLIQKINANVGKWEETGQLVIDD